MALTYVGENAFPTYLALSSDLDISASTINGASLIGKTVYTTDDKAWYIISDTLKLEPFVMPALQTDPLSPDVPG